MESARDLFSYRKYWAHRFGPAPVLPMSRAEMAALGWDECDIILVTGDAYVDHPSFGMALVGRVLEAQGFRVGIIAQPDWRSAEAFQALGRPKLFFGITAGNMDSMVNRYTADRKIRSDDAYTPGGAGGQRPDRAVIVYAQRAREAYSDTPIVIGGIEASLRRIAHYDYWSDTVRRSLLLDAKADLLVYGNAERQIVEIAHRLAAGEPIDALTGIRGTAFVRTAIPAGWEVIDASEIDVPATQVTRPSPGAAPQPAVVRLPAFDDVKGDPVRYAHASRVMHLETNPGNARAGAAPWRASGLAQSAADPADHERTRPHLRAAVHAPPASGLRRRQNSGLRDDPVFGLDPARLLRRLHLLLDHRTRGPHHPEPLRGIGDARDRNHPRHRPRLHRRDLRRRRTDGQHVPARMQAPRDRGRLPQALVRLSAGLPEPQHRSLGADSPLPPRAPCRA